MYPVARKVGALLCATLLTLNTSLFADATTTQDLDIAVANLEYIAISGNVTIASTDFVDDGDGTLSYTDTSSTLDYFTNRTGGKVTIVSDIATPTGMTITVSVSGGTVSGSPTYSNVVLSNSAQDIITDAVNTSMDAGTISFLVELDAGVTSNYDGTLTWTVTGT